MPKFGKPKHSQSGACTIGYLHRVQKACAGTKNKPKSKGRYKACVRAHCGHTVARKRRSKRK